MGLDDRPDGLEPLAEGELDARSAAFPSWTTSAQLGAPIIMYKGVSTSLSFLNHHTTAIETRVSLYFIPRRACRKVPGRFEQLVVADSRTRGREPSKYDG